MPFICTTDSDPLYQGWVDNVRSLKKAQTNIGRIINRQIKLSKILDSGEIRSTDLEIISDLTKSAFLVYSSYTEANLYRLIHLPNSFKKNEVKNILATKDNQDIIQAWLKAITIASNKNNVLIADGIPIGECIINLKKIINQTLKDPSVLRNKIIHGQWSTVYNKPLSAENENLSKEVADIDISKIDGWYKIFDKLAELLKQLIQSPNKGFPVQYSQLISEINKIAIDIKSWNLKTKRARLLKSGEIPQLKI